MGVSIEEKKFLFSLNYADGQVIIAQDADDLEFILKILNKAYKERTQSINFNKTEFIAINTDQEFHINPVLHYYCYFVKPYTCPN
jgi:hypothetical protein